MHAFIKAPVSRLTVERYTTMHLVVQIRTTTGLRCVFKCPEILVDLRTLAAYRSQNMVGYSVAICAFYVFTVT